MAGQLQASLQTVNPYLSPNQQDLLLAALKSRAVASTSIQDTVNSDPVEDPRTMSVATDGALLMSPDDADLDTYGVDFTPDLDYLDGDSFDFENADLGGDMIGALPGSGSGSGTDAKSNGAGHEKRKSRDESSSGDEGDAKRQETQEGEKQAKKPGRKPLTSEPTTKRKAQNRAAQRAFRERKEKHLKDLETKVSELEKASEADKHENGLLKAQVDRLQVELREYRKRLSLNSSSAGRSPPLAATNSQQRSNSNPLYGSNFQFDFPKFGGLPGTQIFGNSGLLNTGVLKRDSSTPPTLSPTNANSSHGQLSQSETSRQNSLGRSMSPPSNHGSMSNVGSPSQFANLDSTVSTYSTNDNMHGFATTLPTMNGSNDPFGDLFSPSILKSTSPTANYFDNSQTISGNNGLHNQFNGDNGNDSTSGLNRVFQFNGGSNASDTTSPSASSTSQWNTNGTVNSSCGTSPEPSHDSPANKDSDKIQTSQQFDASQLANVSNIGQTGLDATFSLANTDFNVPSLGNFDPILFGDYRDSNEAIIGGGGGGDFSGGFFDDALNQTLDLGSPSNLFGILQSPQQKSSTLEIPNGVSNAPTPSKSLLAEIEKAQQGGDDDYGLPNAQHEMPTSDKLISCNNIWNQLQSNPDYQEGKFDIDGLCSELRTKATCSESGVKVPQKFVDAALRKLGQKNEKGEPVGVSHHLMFEQQSWDNVLKKMREGKQ